MSRSGHRRTTAYDIAYQLGIAQSTVSRALNGSKNVSPAMRQRVLLAAQELNYSINQAAARLRTCSPPGKAHSPNAPLKPTTNTTR